LCDARSPRLFAAIKSRLRRSFIACVRLIREDERIGARVTLTETLSPSGVRIATIDRYYQSDIILIGDRVAGTRLPKGASR